MASRFDQQKPDPAIGQNIRRARTGKKPGKDVRGLIVAASLSATLGAWGLFAHQDAQAVIDAQAAAPTTPVTTTAAQDTTASSASSVTVAPTAVPTLVPTTTQAQAAAQATPTTTTSTQTTTQAQVPVARTRSSR